MGQVACTGQMRNPYKLFVKNQNGRDHLEGMGEQY
jgi:hypothetical protein